MVPPSAVDAGVIAADGMETVEGQDAVRERLDVLARSAHDSIRALQPSAELPERQPDSTPSCLVTRRVVVEAGPAGEYGSLSVRRSPDPLPCRVLIIDAAIAVTAADHGVALVVREPVLVRSLLWLFEATWLTCAPARPDAATPAERKLLELLAAGRTDQSIARSLGLSERHVGRRIAHLLQRLEVSSRFAAGVEAVRCGWL